MSLEICWPRDTNGGTPLQEQRILGLELLSSFNRLQLQEKASPYLNNFIITTQLGFDPIDINLVSQSLSGYQKRF